MFEEAPATAGKADIIEVRHLGVEPNDDEAVNTAQNDIGSHFMGLLRNLGYETDGIEKALEEAGVKTIREDGRE